MVRRIYYDQCVGVGGVLCFAWAELEKDLALFDRWWNTKRLETSDSQKQPWLVQISQCLSIILAAGPVRLYIRPYLCFSKAPTFNIDVV